MEGKTVLENRKIEEMEEESNLLVKQDEKNSDSESLENVKNEEQGTETENKEEEMEEEQSSPRGVLEIPISGSDSDHSSRSSSLERTSSFCSEKSFFQRGISGELGYGLQWKNLLGQIKKKTSVRRFTTIPLLGGYDFSKKSLRGKLGRNRSTEDTINCGDVVVPKPSWRNFTYDELKQATDNFSPDKLLGKGGHAEVYKGCLSDGQIVAVKKITKKKKNDEDRVGDFLSELGIIAHIDHPNAARLIGFSADNDLHLVLQFSPHGSLATVLHGSEVSLEWKIRYKVAVGVAEGLQYLHYDCQRRIIHRDITASNILLSEDYEAQISDFGLAKWLPQKWAHHVVSPIEGTFGYMAPEYFMHGIVHEKTDVFAFGVLLLELITGRRAVDSCRQSLVMWAKPLLEKNNVKELTDPKLGNNYDVIEMKRSIFAASTCLHHLPNMRPTMKKVVQLLQGENEPVDMKQKSMGGRALMVDACDLDDYTATTYLKDLNRHMELVME
ncbi:receptor-like cytosolic serine threonine- kinase RBK1 [Olea europaea subsp. europaea]|uniref:non-specific serine/threonine protein kinase n=1 Tax=Olea europaea subsp. europaea TaxID=158383 RepID=A0A8S0SQ22_OLEEU|nr:receptor-like cytosolic serine threonine- kinase RBK1 [Olea europaea subsp. europaea]